MSESRAVVVGAGQMGVVIAWAMGELGFDVCLVDPYADLVKACESVSRWEGPCVTGGTNLDSCLAGWEPDVVISAAPYHQNQSIFDKCLKLRIPYCDLGGDTETSKAIRNRSAEHESLAFTDLGLAPGYVNILAEELYRINPTTKTMYMRAGGLPVDGDYAMTWSVDGLVNEYRGKCVAIQDGKLVEAEAMGDRELEHVFGGDYEAFNTKGGFACSAESFFAKGIREANYKTLRNRGHCDKLNFLMNDCKLSDEDLKLALENCFGYTQKDVVYILVRSDGCVLTLSIPHDSRFTAMQKATAFPAAAVASLVADGEFAFVSDPIYEDVPFDEMSYRLDQLGFFDRDESDD